ATAFIHVVPERVPVPVVSVSATFFVESARLVTLLLNAFSTLAPGCLAKATPATVLAEGWVVNTIWLAAANVIGNAPVVVVFTPRSEERRVGNALLAPTRSMLSTLPTNSATPARSFIEVVPIRVLVRVI